MSYAAAAALQTAIFGALTAAPALNGTQIVDAIPPGGISGTFILIGPEEAKDASDGSGSGADHQFILSVISDASGFLTAKTVAAAASSALLGPPPALTTGRIVYITFLKAKARRLEDGSTRRIDLTFRARIDI